MNSGVRYLEKAVFNLDYGQLKLVFHALKERKQLIDNAPHLCHALPCMTPCFSWFEVVYYWAGLKFYDLVAAGRLLHLSRYFSAQESVELFPTLSKKGNGRDLKGTVVYYDGQMNDSRVNVGLACTAAISGAAVLNHAEVVSLHKDESTGRIIGARIRDNMSGGYSYHFYFIIVLPYNFRYFSFVRCFCNRKVRLYYCKRSILLVSAILLFTAFINYNWPYFFLMHVPGKEFDTFAKIIVNAAGPFCDSVRKLANKDVQPMICPSSGVHIILPDYYSPEGMGLIVPKTKDGRVVFMLPWLGRTVAGTTDSDTIITMLPEPHEDEIEFILDAISDYLNVKVCAFIYAVFLCRHSMLK